MVIVLLTDSLADGHILHTKIHNSSKRGEKHKKDCKFGYFFLPTVRKDAGTKTL